MKKTFQLSAIVILLLIVAIISCSKSSTPAPTTPTKTELLTQSSWKFNAAGLDLDKNGSVDINDSTIHTCVKDNTYLFVAGGTGTMDEGAEKCNAGDPQTPSFNWNFNSGETSLTANIPTFAVAGGAGIFTLTTTQLVLYKDTSFLGQPVRYVVSLKH